MVKVARGTQSMSPPVGAEETAAYVATLAGELSRLSRRSGLPTLAYLLDMARLEAEGHLAGEAALRARPSDPGVGLP
ncbi:hypothetical protein ACFSCV_00850 [Methylopila henanensis]|uniref:Uncharacterized protein n=1 Tax=Methylopila henanensis TaxID=873516 RepID=A0ABW4K2T8_9HYPH